MPKCSEIFNLRPGNIDQSAFILQHQNPLFLKNLIKISAAKRLNHSYSETSCLQNMEQITHATGMGRGVSHPVCMVCLSKILNWEVTCKGMVRWSFLDRTRMLKMLFCVFNQRGQDQLLQRSLVNRGYCGTMAKLLHMGNVLLIFQWMSILECVG